MGSYAELIEPLKRSHYLPEIVSDLSALLRAERERRERFYAEMNEDTNQEFINGVVVLHSPVRNMHLIATRHLVVVLDFWIGERGLGILHSERCLCVFPRNDYEPDIVFFGVEKAAKFAPDTLKFPIPDFIVEVLSESTEAYDRGVKFEDYQAHGVREYWIIDTVAEKVEQYVLRNGRYELVLNSGSGDIASEVITGFRIPVRAIFDPAENRAALRAMMSQGAGENGALP